MHVNNHTERTEHPSAVHRMCFVSRSIGLHVLCHFESRLSLALAPPPVVILALLLPPTVLPYITTYIIYTDCYIHLMYMYFCRHTTDNILPRLVAPPGGSLLINWRLSTHHARLATCITTTGGTQLGFDFFAVKREKNIHAYSDQAIISIYWFSAHHLMLVMMMLMVLMVLMLAMTLMMLLMMLVRG